MRVPLFVSAFASCGVSFVAAQPNPDSKADQPAESLPAIFAPRAPPKNVQSEGAPRPASSTPPLRRAISPEMSAKLAAVVTRAAPPVGAIHPAGEASTPSAASSSDAVQLKPYVVREDRLPEFKDRDMLTTKGRLELARRRYAGLGPMTDSALLKRLEEDFAFERLHELKDLKGLLEIGDAKLSPELKRNIDEMIMQMRPIRPGNAPPDFGLRRRAPE